MEYLTVARAAPFDELTARHPRTMAEAFGGRHESPPLRKTLHLRPPGARSAWRHIIDGALCALPALIVGFILGSI